MRIIAISVPKNGIGLLFIIGLLSACGPRSKEIVKTDLNISYSVESAPEWTQLFYRKDGWFGADGIFTIPLTGRDRQGNLGNDSTLIFFSDTYIGKVVENKPDQSSVMVNNSVAYLKGNQPIADSLIFSFIAVQLVSQVPFLFQVMSMLPRMIFFGWGMVSSIKNCPILFMYLLIILSVLEKMYMILLNPTSHLWQWGIDQVHHMWINVN